MAVKCTFHVAFKLHQQLVCKTMFKSTLYNLFIWSCLYIYLQHDPQYHLTNDRFWFNSNGFNATFKTNCVIAFQAVFKFGFDKLSSPIQFKVTFKRYPYNYFSHAISN